MKINKKHAFTLAEVLITIGIIGVVAALVIPYIAINIEKIKNVSTLKIAYTELQNYVQMYANDNICIDDLLDCEALSPKSFDSAQALIHSLADYLVEKKSFKYIKPGDRWGMLNSPYQIHPYDYLCKDHCILAPNNKYALNFWFDTTVIYGIRGLPGENIYINVYIYTNPNNMVPRGSSKKSVLDGKDKFTAFITNKKRVIPNGSQLCGGYSCNKLNSTNCTKDITARNSRVACFQKIIDDGWKIKYY